MNDLAYYSDIAEVLADQLRRRPERAQQLEPLLAETRTRLLAAQPATLRFARVNSASEASSRARFESKARGADVLALVVLNPGQWIDLSGGTWRRAEGRLTWQATPTKPTLEAAKKKRAAIGASIKEFLQRLHERKPELARALDFAHARTGPGLHLQALPDGTVQAMWRPRPAMKIDATSPP